MTLIEKNKNHMLFVLPLSHHMHAQANLPRANESFTRSQEEAYLLQEVIISG